MARAEEARPNAGDWFQRALNSPFLGSLASFLLAIGAAALLISLAGFDAGEGYSAMLRGYSGECPLRVLNGRHTSLTGLRGARPLRAGLFNVGAEGQTFSGRSWRGRGMLQGFPHGSIPRLLARFTAVLLGWCPLTSRQLRTR
jgi:ABC-type uncharacterized transport system permease subunit